MRDDIFFWKFLVWSSGEEKSRVYCVEMYLLYCYFYYAALMHVKCNKIKINN